MGHEYVGYNEASQVYANLRVSDLYLTVTSAIWASADTVWLDTANENTAVLIMLESPIII